MLASAGQALASGTYPPAPPKLGEEVTRSIDPETYNLGKSIYVGRAQLQGASLTRAQVEETQRKLEEVVALIPARARAKMDIPELARQMSPLEEEALLYYLQLRFRFTLPVA